jgi:hypothetical protein
MDAKISLQCPHPQSPGSPGVGAATEIGIPAVAFAPLHAGATLADPILDLAEVQHAGVQKLVRRFADLSRARRERLFPRQAADGADDDVERESRRW